MPKQLDYSKLREATCDAALAFYKLCLKSAKKDRVIGLAVCPDEEMQSVFLMGDSSASLPKHKKLITDDVVAESGLSRELLCFGLRFDSVADWTFSDYKLKDKGAGRITTALTKTWKTAGKDLKNREEQAVRKECAAAMVAGLSDFAAAVDLAGTVDRDEFALLLWIPDPGEKEAKDNLTRAKALNTPAFFKQLKKIYVIE